MGEQGSLGLDAAAAHLGVHYQTVYRWVRAGKLSASRIDGRYSIKRADLEEFERRRTEPSAPPEPSVRRLARQRDAFLGALLVGDETKAQSIVSTLRSNGTSVARLIDAVIAPALREVGDGWHEGVVSVAEEHRATAIVERVLGSVTPNPRGRRRGMAVVVVADDDQHVLPGVMATAALREDHWTVEHLGGNLPLDELLSFVARQQVDLVVISTTNVDSQSTTHRWASKIEEKFGIPVLAGRPGVGVLSLQESARAAIG